MKHKIIQISEWVKLGLLVKRSALSEEHPESYYHKLEEAGVIPEDYGYFLYQRNEYGEIIGVKNLDRVLKILKGLQC